MYAIVGNGLAGVSLARILYEQSIDFRLFSDNVQSASHISSGIINPITGRRYALTWNFNLFRDSALDFYGEFIHKVPIKRFYKPYSESSNIYEDMRGKEEWAFVQDAEWINIHESYQVEVSNFLTFWLNKFEKNNTLINEKFIHNDLKIENGKFGYQGIEFEKIIFAEGIGIKFNPYFNHLPFQLNRGEALKIKVDKFELATILQKGKFICSYEGAYWVGSSFEKVDFDDPPKTEKMFEELKSYIPYLVENREFKILEHLGAFRVTIPDRRPIIGEHPNLKNMFLFNGFGTKGVSLIPYFSHQLLAHISQSKELDKAVQLSRFLKTI